MYGIDKDVFFLILSLVVLGIAPILCNIARNVDGLLRGLDGFVLVAMGGMALLHVLPEIYNMAGWYSLLALVLGVFGPGVIENRLQKLARPAHLIALISALIGICFHSFLDGLALAHVDGTEDNSEVHMLPIIVVLHRLPIGIMVWLLIRPVYGLFTTCSTFVILGLSTILGFIIGEISIGGFSTELKGIVFAFVTGTLLHVVIHRPYPITEKVDVDSKYKWYAGMGALLGIVFVYVMLVDNLEASAIEFCNSFISLAWESAPALLLAYVMAGLLYSFFPKTSLNWLSRGRNLSQSLRGMAFGLPIPICSCGVVPIYRSLVAQGVPTSAALSFMIATPELSIDAVLLTLPLLGGQFTVIRVVCAVVLAVVIGWLVGRFASRNASLKKTEYLDQKKETIIKRFQNGIRVGFGPIVDDTAPWILLGLSAASIVQPIFSALEYGKINMLMEVVVFALLGIPTYVCASGATPLAAVLVFNGVSPGAALAFLLTGPATNVTTFSMLSNLHSRKIALSVAVGVTACAIGLGQLVNILFPAINVPELHLHEHVEWSGINGLCLLILVVVFLGSIFRLGPRKFIEVTTVSNSSTNMEDQDFCCDEDLDCCDEKNTAPNFSNHKHCH